MPRLFTGLQIPDPIARELSLLRGGIPGARWIDESDYHITLRFIGDIDLQLAREIDHELSLVNMPILKIDIDSLDWFGGAKPRAVIALAKLSPQLLVLQSEHERAVRRAGGMPDKRKFSPHVTIARLRNSTPEQVGDFLSAKNLPAGLSFEVSEFALFSARDSVGGGPYRVEAVYPSKFGVVGSGDEDL